MKNKYKLSILIPTYNRLNLFKETLKSIIPQAQEKPVHIAIVDDGSTEGNYEYVLELRKRYPFIEVVKHEKNLGVGSARNTLLQMAKGDYLLFLDSDDLLLDRALNEMLNLIDSKTAEVYVLNSYRQKEEKLKFKSFPEGLTKVELLKCFLDRAFSEALYLIKTEIAKKISFNPNLKVREDLGPKVCYLLFNKIKIINKPLAIIRDSPQRLRRTPNYYFEHAIASVEDLFSRLPSEYQILKPYAFGNTYLELAKMAYKGRLFFEAEKFLEEAKNFLPELNKNFNFLKLKAKLIFKKIF